MNAAKWLLPTLLIPGAMAQGTSDRNFFQSAFAPENQPVTFFVLFLAVILLAVGAVYVAVRRSGQDGAPEIES